MESTKPFISESIIDKQAEIIGGQSDNFQHLLEDFRIQQPAVLAFLFSDSFKVLTQEEKEYMLYLALVIWKSCSIVDEEIPELDQKSIAEKEEDNWEKLNDAVGKSFRDKLDVFFEGYPQEDLLAFVEDSLVIEEGEEDEIALTKEGRDPIFIALKTVIDCLATD